MKYPIALKLIPFMVILLFGVAGCADAIQDESEIPATIGVADEVMQEEAVQKEVIQDQEAPLAVEPIEFDTHPQDDTEETPAAGYEPGNSDLAAQLRREREEFKKQSIEIPKTWKRMGKSHLWADLENKRVIVRGAICLEQGLLEMFACPRQTKEHEAVVSVHAPASEVHATLLAMGHEPGKPMVWTDKYYPASGPVMNIELWWNDKDGKRVERRAQEMIRNTDTGKAMDSEFVFGGSEQIYDPYEKKNTYMADYGPMINVANQPDAMIDVSIQSDDEAQGSLFEAFTENVPPVNTKVYIVISATGKVIKASKIETPEPKTDEPAEPKTPAEAGSGKTS